MVSVSEMPFFFNEAFPTRIFISEEIKKNEKKNGFTIVNNKDDDLVYYTLSKLCFFFSPKAIRDLKTGFRASLGLGWLLGFFFIDKVLLPAPQQISFSTLSLLEIIFREYNKQFWIFFFRKQSSPSIKEKSFLIGAWEVWWV